MSSKDSHQRKRGSTENGAEERSSSKNAPKDEESNKKQKLTIGFGKKPEIKPKHTLGEKKGIQIKLGSQSSNAGSSKPKPTAVAAAFNDDSDSEPEEMPPEAKMRMRNIGRETPTSAGPNSFGKTKQGFCDAKKVFEKSLKQAQDTLTSTASNTS
ncbi:hypothetical protein B566_EDAN013402 [Ephemera danica]|nr:hypothetical protein B566_EDAN013402 [Ephemera danica]